MKRRQHHSVPTPIAVGVANVRRELAGEGTAKEAAAIDFLPKHLRSHPPTPNNGLLRARCARFARVVRRIGPKVGFVPWFLSDETTRRDVEHWLHYGWRETGDPDEKELVRRLLTGKARFRHSALAFVLWHCGVLSLKRNARYVKGLCRGMIARVSPYRNLDRTPLHVDRISVHLKELRAIVGEDFFNYWQPSPDEAVANDLPHSTQYLDDGRTLSQAVMIYRFALRGCSGPTPAGSGVTYRVDPGSTYGNDRRNSDAGVGAAGGSVSAQTPTVDPASAGRLKTGPPSLSGAAEGLQGPADAATGFEGKGSASGEMGLSAETSPTTQPAARSATTDLRREVSAPAGAPPSLEACIAAAEAAEARGESFDPRELLRRVREEKTTPERGPRR